MRKCTGKIRYETKDQALKARTAQVSAGKWSLSNTNSYRCDQCGGYHNGHTGRPAGKGRGKRR